MGFVLLLLGFGLKCAISLLSGHLPITRITFVAFGTVPVVTLRGSVGPVSFSVYAPLVRTVIAWCHALVGVATIGDFLFTVLLFWSFMRVGVCAFRLFLFLPFLFPYLLSEGWIIIIRWRNGIAVDIFLLRVTGLIECQCGGVRFIKRRKHRFVGKKELLEKYGVKDTGLIVLDPSFFIILEGTHSVGDSK